MRMMMMMRMRMRIRIRISDPILGYFKPIFKQVGQGPSPTEHSDRRRQHRGTRNRAFAPLKPPVVIGHTGYDDDNVNPGL